jgi:L-amino acid N-acyltransferase YncA
VTKANLAIELAPMTEQHWFAVRAIYQAGIDTGHATFASSPPADWSAWSAHRLNDLSLVALQGTEVLGWVCASSVSDRCVYAGVAEESVYVSASCRDKGVGRTLLAGFIQRAESHNIWTLQTGIFPENETSVALHHSVGFKTVGLRQRLGQMTFGPLAGRWRDVLLLERRSTVTGL